ncbi:triacylglycerol lipase [Aliikangiella sp. G2MR2-5]|uniref:esterase/lipase family protein n=1 Tax=Aliikangiella sp. G2MR2-5 TaxID=2788943 RepID=UPI0018A91086|nr:phospholipase [Aliikangiella sp. G2MR2-5]
MTKQKIVLVFVHGWSVTNTDTYGGLPERLKAELFAAGMDVLVKDIFLGRYISFHDEVRLPDISRAFDTAVKDELTTQTFQNIRFVCITHSTGGPVIRDWWHRYYLNSPKSGKCPMSHLIMLAPANYGSALAQLGKGRLSRMKSWFGGVEPGQGVLDWLELGSEGSWGLNSDWISTEEKHIGVNGIFPFVLTGQSIDRAIYDNLNTYTGESGSDGVVRVAAANLQGRLIRLQQQKPIKGKKKIRNKMVDCWDAPELQFISRTEAPVTALGVIAGKSHSGKDMGIMRSVKKGTNDKSSQQTVKAILECIKVSNKSEYNKLATQFEQESSKVQKLERLESVKHLLFSDTHFIHDRYSMVVFRVTDHEGYPVKDFDLILTAGVNSDPNMLPQGFFKDKQRNSVSRNTITYYFNYDIMIGSGEIKHDGEIIRKGTVGAQRLGLKILPRPSEGFVHYLPCEISASQELLERALKPNSTTLIDICLRRVVHKNVMRLDKGTAQKPFNKTKPGEEIVQ